MLVTGVPILAAAGLVVAAKSPPPVDEVSVTSLSWSGTIETTDPGADVTIPLNVQETYSVTRR